MRSSTPAPWSESPSRLMASTCALRPISVTSRPERASRPPKYEPSAPAPTTATLPQRCSLMAALRPRGRLRRRAQRAGLGGSAAERLRHHLFAAAVLFLDQLAAHRLARERRRRTGHAPAAREHVLLGPPLGVVADVVVADLIDFGGVLDHEAVRL